MDEIWAMCGQLDLEVILNLYWFFILKNHPIFINLGVKKVNTNKDPKHEINKILHIWMS